MLPTCIQSLIQLPETGLQLSWLACRGQDTIRKSKSPVLKIYISMLLVQTDAVMACIHQKILVKLKKQQQQHRSDFNVNVNISCEICDNTAMAEVCTS